MGFFSKILKTVKFELSHSKGVIKEVFKHPLRTITGPTPLGTKLHNAIFGTKYKPMTGQLGGSTQDERNAYEAKNGSGSLGFANATNAIANVIAGWYAGGALTKVGGNLVSRVGSQAANAGGTASAAGTTAGSATGAAEDIPEVVVTAQRIGSGQAAATGAGIGAGGAGAGASGAPRSADSTLPPGTAAPVANAPAQTGGFLSGLKNAATSEQGLAIIGGALQGYATDKQQQRQIEEQRRYTRPFTTDEISGMTRGMDVRVPGGFLENARRVGEFLNGRPQIGPSSLTPEQVAAMARGG